MPRKRNASDRLIPVEKQKRVILVERRKRRGHFDIQNIGVIVEVILFLVIVSIGAAFILLQLHKAKIRDVAAKAIPELMQLQDGTFDLRWPSFANADYYSVEISTYSVWGSRNEGTILFKELVDKNSCRLPNIQSDEGLTLRIEPIRKYKFFGEEKYRRENTPIVRQFYIQSPSVKNLKWKIDSETKEVSVKVDSQGSNCYGLYITEPDGTRNQIKVENEREFVLNFVGEESLPIPEPEKPCIVTCVPGNCVNGMTIYGSETKDIAQETFQYETPKVLVFNVNAMRYSEPVSEAYNRLTIDGMRWSGSKAGVIKASMTEEEQFLSYVFPLLRYHSRYDKLTEEDFDYLFRTKDNTFNGFQLHTQIRPKGSLPVKKSFRITNLRMSVMNI